MFEKEIALLEQTKTFDTDESFDRFEQAIVSILSYEDPRSISVLLGYLRDEEDYPEMMYQIIHAVESFPMDDYIIQLLKSLSAIYKTSPDNTRTLIYRVLNKKVAFTVLKKYIKKKHIDFSGLKRVLQDISDDSPDHQPLCKELLGML